jgi:DNA adenine methylase
MMNATTSKAFYEARGVKPLYPEKEWRLIQPAPHMAGATLSPVRYEGRVPSPLKTHGGKFYLAQKILALAPPHVHYCEPFAGGLAVLLAKNPEGVSELVNDLDGRLMNFWDVLRDRKLFPHFLREVRCIPLSRQAWERAAAHRYGFDHLADAVAFFVFARQSLGGRTGGWTAITRTRTRRGMNGNVSEWQGAVEGLPTVHERLYRVALENRPALEVIAREDTADTWFYLDPPYLQETRSSKDTYGAFEMTGDDHRQLLDLIKRCKGKVMISGYPSKLYDDALRGWTRHTFDLPNNAAGGKDKRRMTEVLWCNF